MLIATNRPGPQTGIHMDYSDAIYILLVVICAWLAVYWDENGGGGKRQRAAARA